MKEHIIKEGSKYHVLWWDTDGKHCSEKDCEINHRLKNRKKSAGQDANASCSSRSSASQRGVE